MRKMVDENQVAGREDMEGAWIGAEASIMAGVIIGKYAIFGTMILGMLGLRRF